MMNLNNFCQFGIWRYSLVIIFLVLKIIISLVIIDQNTIYEIFWFINMLMKKMLCKFFSFVEDWTLDFWVQNVLN